MKPFLMGLETEYAVSGRRGERAVLREGVCERLLAAVRGERATMPQFAMGLGMFLEQGGRLYLDAGPHPEYATPEVSTPEEMALYDKAGERLLARAKARMREETPELEVTLLKNNVAPADPGAATWGTHESYTCWVPAQEAAPALIPHLASRIVYAGAGALSARGGGYELSQRARHLVEVRGPDTTSSRALFCTRTGKPADSGAGWWRAHLVAKDAHRAPLGTWLACGVTGLLFVALNHGHRVGRGLGLAHPLRALEAFSLDPGLQARAELEDGRRLTAVEIQEGYLEECEGLVQGGGFPDWAGEVLRRWRETLEDLRRDPFRLADRLDVWLKLLILDHEVRRAGCTWGELHGAIRALTALRRRSRTGVRSLLAGSVAQETRPGWRVRPDHLRLAARLQALEQRYHELGGLYDELAGAGRVREDVAPPDRAGRAEREPPPGGRAAVRGGFIRAHRGDGDWVADWRFLLNLKDGLVVDLRDPFLHEAVAVPADRLPAEAWVELRIPNLPVLARILRGRPPERAPVCAQPREGFPDRAAGEDRPPYC